MLEIQPGSIVKSVAGHDSGGYFVVLRQEGEYVFLADGKRRKLEKPKRKKWKHVRLTEVDAISVTNGLTDKQIRAYFGQLNLR